MKRAIITGANGLIGGALVRELLKYGYRIYALGREEQFHNLPKDLRVICVSFNLANTDELKSKLPVRGV